MEATPTTRQHRRSVSIGALCVALAVLSALVAAACALENLAMLLAAFAALGVAVPLVSLAIGWPILLIFGGKTALDVFGRWRRSPPRSPE